MATLSNPTLTIDPLTGSTHRVTATVRVQFTPEELSDINRPPVERPGVSVVLKSNLWGSDLNERRDEGEDDLLLSFPNRNITRSAVYTFSTVVSTGLLNEDSRFRDLDEIFNKFSLVSSSPSEIPDRNRNTPIITGYYGSSRWV